MCSRQDRAIRRNLRASSSDGALYGVMVGVGETYVPAFALAVGLGEISAGLVASAPVFLGSLLQLFSPWAIRHLGSNRRWVVLSAAIQGACFLPLMLAAYGGTIRHIDIYAITTVYWAMSLGTGPAWNTWMGTLIPKSIRAGYFAKRSRLNQAMTLGGFLMGGCLLQYGKSWEAPTLAFAILFTVAFVMRTLSALCLSIQTEVAPPPIDRDVNVWKRMKTFGRGPNDGLLLFAVMMQVGVCVSGPYFVPYMLKNLHLSYLEYVMLIGASYTAKFVTLPFWGRVAKSLGVTRLLWIGAVCITPMAAAWDVSTSYPWLIMVQLMAGTAWAAYELAITLLFLESIPESERTATLTIYNVANNLALAIGSWIGMAVLRGMSVTTEAYMTIFAISTVIRGCSLALLARTRTVDVPSADAIFRPVSLRPGPGSLDVPVLAGIPESSEITPQEPMEPPDSGPLLTTVR